ncbi:hypothetical protein INT43_002598 [Umbelopsis isabellina]|uniref:Uncharacterized protein n=1 Tax=Mortierella isabellina TaxID=91625 RepID=A0A8H7Q5Y4_MORIS|nr:hypothetical protein INT43_002598 [Umbelopsis isabellina]
MSKFVSRAGDQIDQLQEQLTRRETNEERESPSQPQSYGAIEDNRSSFEKPKDGEPFEDSFGESSQVGSTGFLRRTSANTTSAGPRRGRPTVARPMLPTVHSGVVQHAAHDDAAYDVTRNKRHKSAAKRANSTPDSSKLGTFEGVFTPAILSIWSIIVFLRFSFIVSEAGVVATLMMFSVGYMCVIFFWLFHIWASPLFCTDHILTLMIICRQIKTNRINVLTTLSMSAISTNGTVRGGGTYYMISRSLGSPEFGGSIGLVFWMGQCMSAAMSATGFSEPLLANLGQESGQYLNVLPEGQVPLSCTYRALLVMCVAIAMAGPKTYARSSLFLACFVLLGTLSIFVSFAFKEPFIDGKHKVIYTGFQWWTLQQNLWPQFSRGNTLATIFGVLFPCCNGVLAGASLSGDLKKPSDSIPEGTLHAVWITYVAYCLLVIMMGGSIDRTSMIEDLNILQDISLIPSLFILGSFATMIYSVLGAIVGASKIMQAIARDDLLPFLYFFKRGTSKNDTPSAAILLTLGFILLVCTTPSVNIIASMVTLTALLTFSVLNLACAVLKISAAPNFRPNFKYFRWWTATVGLLMAISAMIYVSPTLAICAFVVVLSLLIVIHYTSPPKKWGNITQSLIYHQVRKYLLRLDTRKEHVKFWRPQILLLVNNPRTSIGLIAFCNALKKGGLYILGHTIKGEFSSALPELDRQQTSWLRYVDAAKVKAFTNITIADSERLGARSLVLGSGLGGMRPNLVILGAFNIQAYRDLHFSTKVNTTDPDFKNRHLPPSREGSRPRNLYLQSRLPADTSRAESPIVPTDYVAIIEDLLRMNKSIGVGFGFDAIETMEASQEEYRKYQRYHKRPPRSERRYIDVWPIQVASPEEKTTEAAAAKSALTTYTMILQLATILNMVQQWRKQYRLRVVCFVEHPQDIPEERRRVASLLENLRIRAELLVISLADTDSTNIDMGDATQVTCYTAITQGKEGVNEQVDALLVGTQWWNDTWKPTDGESNHASTDHLSTKAIKSTKSHRTEESYNTDTDTDIDHDSLTDHEGDFAVPPNASVWFPENSNTVISGFDPMERRYSPPQLLTRYASIPSSLTMRVVLPSENADRLYDSSSSSSDESDTSEDEELDAGSHRRQSRINNITSKITEPVLGAIGLGKTKTSNTSSTPSELGQLLDNWRANPPKLAETQISNPTDRIQDYGSTNDVIQPDSKDDSGVKKLEFNDLPSRAQHLIINEKMRRVSPPEHTAVLFSALPAPLSGTHQHEQDSLAYIENLEVLVQDLPPAMLIHANSLTVTMAL